MQFIAVQFGILEACNWDGDGVGVVLRADLGNWASVSRQTGNARL